jgi:hypothetical protein
MPFVRMPGVTGKVYVPELLPGQPQKHPCPDCFACQHCSDDRCAVCRSESAGGLIGDDCRAAGSGTKRQGYHHCKQQQQEKAQALKESVE